MYMYRGEWEKSIVEGKKALELVKADGYVLNNLDATIVAQQPELKEHIPAMCRKIAEVFESKENLINIKATTTEFLGFCGRMEGIEAYAVLTLRMHTEESP